MELTAWFIVVLVSILKDVVTFCVLRLVLDGVTRKVREIAEEKNFDGVYFDGVYKQDTKRKTTITYAKRWST